MPRFHAIQKIAGVLTKLRLRIACLIGDRLRPEFCRRGCFDGSRPSHRMSAGKLRNRAFGIDSWIRCHHKTTPGDGQASFRAKEFQSEWILLATGRFAMRPDSRPAGILEKGILSVRRLSIVLQAESAAHAA